MKATDGINYVAQSQNRKLVTLSVILTALTEQSDKMRVPSVSPVLSNVRPIHRLSQ